jgi:hypothetical protein
LCFISKRVVKKTFWKRSWSSVSDLQKEKAQIS